VAERSLGLESPEFVESWVDRVLVGSSLESSVAFVDSSHLGPIERTDEAGICNDLEAEIVLRFRTRPLYYFIGLFF
jgi:hypothetical protein